MRTHLSVLIALSFTPLLAAPTRAAIHVATGSYVVAQGSSITTTVTVTDTSPAAPSTIEGLVFTWQIGPGTGATPAISAIDLLTNTVWTGKVSSVLTPAGGNLPQYQSRDLFTDTPGDVIIPNGTLARVTISTASAPLGDYPLLLTGTRTPGRDSALLDGPGASVPTTFSGGTLTVATAGDATLDGKVDAFDLNALAAHWQAATDITWAKGDFTSDGKVDAFDLNALAANWQINTAGSLESALATFPVFSGTAPIPEPASIAILALGTTLLARRRR